MTPEGPYCSPYCALEHYLVSTIYYNKIVYVIVPNGTQPNQGVICENKRVARIWLAENGFTKQLSQ